MRYIFENFVLDTDRRELRRGTAAVSVTPQVFDLLEFLIRNRGRVVSRDDLIAAIWNGRIVSDSALTTRLNVARHAVGDSGEIQRVIRTLARKGFRFVGVVREEPAQSALAQSDNPSIAILPFTNTMGGRNLEFFADGSQRMS